MERKAESREKSQPKQKRKEEKIRKYKRPRYAPHRFIFVQVIILLLFYACLLKAM